MKTKTKSTVVRRRVKRRQQRVSHKKFRTLRSGKYARKTARKVMRGGLLNSTEKSINIKVGEDRVVNEAFKLSFRRSFTNSKTTVLLELVININKYTERIPLLLDTLLSDLLGIDRYKLRLDSTIFDRITRQSGFENNKKLSEYTPGKFIGDYGVEGIYKDNDRRVGLLYSKSEMGQLFDRRISIDTINNEMKKMEKTNESKVTFSISVENGKIKIKDVKISTIFCNPATILLTHMYNSNDARVLDKFFFVNMHPTRTRRLNHQRLRVH